MDAKHLFYLVKKFWKLGFVNLEFVVGSGEKYNSEELIMNLYLKWKPLPILRVQKGKGCESFFLMWLCYLFLSLGKQKKGNYLSKKVAPVKKGLSLIYSAYT